MTCVGYYEPGFGSVEEMSTDAILETINSSKAEFFAAAFGAKKAQVWLLRNHERLQIPVRAHLGATINFQAGTVRRAPALTQKLALEWLWRITQEPQLWRRYWSDGMALLRLLIARIAPLMALSWVDTLGPPGCRARIDDRKLARPQIRHIEVNGYATVATLNLRCRASGTRRQLRNMSSLTSPRQN